MLEKAGLLSKLKWLDADKAIIPVHLEMMEKYNRLPNDALILATCKLTGIKQIASYDADVNAACLGENTRLIQSVNALTA